MSDQQPSEESTWPYASLLIFGYFGGGTAGARQLRWRTAAALVLLAIGVWGISGRFGSFVPQLLWASAIPLAVFMICWAYVMYLRTLDELSRRIQLEAFALAYGAAMVLVFGVVAFSMQSPDHRASLSAITWWLVGAEAFRGVALVHLARKYR
ncbi:MAG: hypothetical protein ACR2NS_14725 [Gemmatimonadaceae bacterium]